MNNITTIDSHVLLPHQANWQERPAPARLWRCEVAAALSGKEDRSTVRGAAWRTMRYQVLPYNHVERSRFDDRIRAALKAGKMAVPHWGRGVALDSRVDIGDKALWLERTSDIADGEHVVIQSHLPAEFDTWDVAVVVSVSGRQITLSSEVANAYIPPARVWPLLFGRPDIDDFKSVNLNRSRTTVGIQFDQRQIKPLAYDNFEDYELGVVYSSLSGGEGWAQAWVLGAYI